jgi:hypothetical protein
LSLVEEERRKGNKEKNRKRRKNKSPSEKSRRTKEYINLNYIPNKQK